MLTLTESAGTVVSDLVARAAQTDTAGMRIQQGQDRFDIAIAEAPTNGEVVVEQGAARVFLDPQLADVLTEMTLDANVGEGGQVQFALTPQH